MRSLSLALGVLLCSAPLHAYDLIRFLDEIPIEGTSKAVAVAAAQGRTYVVDEKEGALLILDGKGEVLHSVSGKLSGPRGVAVGPEGEVYVADTKDSRVQVFGPDGEPLRSIGRKGSAPGELSKPESVAVGLDGRVYVADTGNDRIEVFTREGVFLFGFGESGREKGQLKEPTRVHVDAADHVYVLDAGNERVQTFDPLTRPDKEFKIEGDDFAMDEYGFLYMIDRKRGRVEEVFDGVSQGRFGAAGRGKGQFRKPEGISVAPDGTILIVDTGNKRIKRVRLTSKLKERKIQHSLATKLLVSGPESLMRFQATVLAAQDDRLYAYLPKAGQFVILDAKGKELVRFGRKSGKGDDVTKEARGLAVSGKHGIYAADSKENRIQRFDLKGGHKGNFGETKGAFASKKKEGRVNDPSGIAINEKGTVYIANTGNHRVEAFSPEGTFLFGVGPQVGPFELDEPVAAVFDPEGFLFVLDRGLKKVLKCEPSGGYIKAWGEEGSAVGGFEDPVALAYDGRSYLYVLDRELKRVSVFDREGRWVTDFFSGGDDDRSLKRPEGLAVLGDSLVVSDPGRVRIASFRLHPRLAPPLSISTQTVEGEVVLKWMPIDDPWVERYRIERSTRAFGPFAKVGTVQTMFFKDARVEPYKTYYYRLAVVADTGDVGPYTRPVEVFIAGAFNVAPVEISTVSLKNIFSSNYKWYKDHPVGEVEVRNNVNLPFRNVKVSFRLKDYTDFAAEKTIPRLEGKQEAAVELFATLNNRILEVTEDTPIQAEIRVTYFEKGKKQEVSKALPLRIYSLNAITWEDPERIADYVTTNDPPVKTLKADILNSAPEGPRAAAYLNENIVTAMKLWEGLSAAGVRFQASASNPFEKVSEDPAFPVDYTQFPRETLRLKSGECDDLATLTASLLEAAQIQAVLIDYPGHMALAFDSDSNDTVEVGLPEDKLIEHRGRFWVPLEPTLIGSSFDESLRKAAFAYKEMKAEGKARIIDLREAWKTYAPATLPPTEQAAAVPDAEAFRKGYGKAAEAVLKLRYEYLTGLLKGMLDKTPGDVTTRNHLGIVYAQHGKLDAAVREFEKALKTAPDDATTMNNLGSAAFMKEDYEAARTHFEKAVRLDPEDAGVWMNMARIDLKLGKKDLAREHADKAVKLSKELKPVAESLLK